MILLVFAFLAGLVTILSPCILPILPIVLSGSLLTGKHRPLGVIIGFVTSFTFFAVFSFSLARALGLSTDVLRNVAVILLILFGLSTFMPQLQVMLERLTSRF
ncbi:MAG: Cytochrome C biogenesis protein transmembrane region [Microgenomates bacterium OLB23]|nr:MAG: Cytochrome C biogenesis protein transmembrane region [Microgenomates bacterium OLB23]